MGRAYRRTEPYKEDSTKGNSLLNNPKNYKGDALVQVWIDSRILATLSVWLDKERMITRYMSEVVKDPLNVLVNYLIELGEVEMVDDTNEARDLLERKYRVILNPNGRGEKNLHHNRLLSNSRHSLKDSIDRSRIEPDVNQPMDANRDVSMDRKIEEASRKAQDIYNKLYGNGFDNSIEAREAEKKRIMSSVKIGADGLVEISPSNIGSVTDETINKWQSNEIVQVKEVKVTGSGMLRKKSDAELELEGERIAKKDAELAKQMNEMPARNNVVKVDD